MHIYHGVPLESALVANQSWSLVVGLVSYGGRLRDVVVSLALSVIYSSTCVRECSTSADRVTVLMSEYF